MSGELSITVPPGLVEAIADRVATIVTTEINTTTTGTPYMTVAEAAEYLRWSKERIYKLTAARAIPPINQDGRPLFTRDDLERRPRNHAEGPRTRHTASRTRHVARSAAR